MGCAFNFPIACFTVIPEELACFVLPRIKKKEWMKEVSRLFLETQKETVQGKERMNERSVKVVFGDAKRDSAGNSYKNDCQRHHPATTTGNLNVTRDGMLRNDLRNVVHQMNWFEQAFFGFVLPAIPINRSAYLQRKEDRTYQRNSSELWYDRYGSMKQLRVTYREVWRKRRDDRLRWSAKEMRTRAIPIIRFLNTLPIETWA